jgi:hypothetical protein
LFFVHHGVGSEDWSSDGFDRLTANWLEKIERAGMGAERPAPALRVCSKFDPPRTSRQIEKSAAAVAWNLLDD